MKIVLNGEPHDGAPTVADVLERHLGHRAPRGVAVALNRVVVPRDTWPSTLLHYGDVVDVVTAVQGG